MAGWPQLSAPLTAGNAALEVADMGSPGQPDWRSSEAMMVSARWPRSSSRMWSVAVR